MTAILGLMLAPIWLAVLVAYRLIRGRDATARLIGLRMGDGR